MIFLFFFLYLRIFLICDEASLLSQFSSVSLYSFTFGLHLLNLLIHPTDWPTFHPSRERKKYWVNRTSAEYVFTCCLPQTTWRLADNTSTWKVCKALHLPSEGSKDIEAYTTAEAPEDARLWWGGGANPMLTVNDVHFFPTLSFFEGVAVWFIHHWPLHTRGNSWKLHSLQCTLGLPLVYFATIKHHFTRLPLKPKSWTL